MIISVFRLGKKDKICDISIPSYIFRSRPLTTYEALVEFLKDVKGMNYHEIGMILDRNERDIRKVYLNAKEKRKNARKRA